MKKLIKICSLILVILMIVDLNSAFAYASETNDKITLKFDYDESVKANDNVTINLKIQCEDNVNTSQIVAVRGTLVYDTAIFENPTIKGENNFSGTMNSSNGQFTLDSQSFTNGQIIGTITLKVKNVSSNSNTTLSVKDIQIGLQDNTLVEISTLIVGSMKIIGTGITSENNEKILQNAGESNSTDIISQNSSESRSTDKTTQNMIENDSTNETSINEKTGSGSTSKSSSNNSSSGNLTVNNATNGTSIEKSNYIQPVNTDRTTSANALPKAGWKVYAFFIVIVLALIDIIGYTIYRNKYL